MSRLHLLVLALLSMVACAAPLRAQNFFTGVTYGATTVSLGNAGSTLGGGVHQSWAIFSLSGGVTITDPDLSGLGGPDVMGNVGIAGGGSLNMSLSNISGAVYQATGSYNNGGTISGGIFQNTDTAYLNQGATDALNASAAAAGLARTVGSGPTQLVLGGALSGSNIVNNDTTAISLSNISGGGSITGAAGTNYVLNLTDLILSGANAVLTLSGASTTNFVINVNRYMSLSAAAKIQLTGGLTAANVLFNVKNNNPQYDVTLSGGSVVEGIILAPTRNVKLTGSSYVYGEVIGKGVSLSGHSHVIVSP